MRGVRLFVSVLVFSFAAAAFAQAQPAQQPQPPQLTWVRFFSVDMARSEEWAAYQKQSTGAVFNKLLSDGKIVGWGMAMPLLLAGQDYTHAIWVTMQNWSGADAVNDGFESAMKKMTPAEMEKEMQMMGAVKSMPRDVILRHLAQSTTPPASTAALKYLRITYYTINPGRNDDVLSLFKEVEPTYADLAKRGAIAAYGFSTQEIVTDPSWTHMVWYFTNEMAKFDDARNAIMGLPTFRTVMLRLRDMSDPTKVHGEVLRVLELKSAQPRPSSK